MNDKAFLDIFVDHVHGHATIEDMKAMRGLASSHGGKFVGMKSDAPDEYGRKWKAFRYEFDGRDRATGALKDIERKFKNHPGDSATKAAVNLESVTSTVAGIVEALLGEAVRFPESLYGPVPAGWKFTRDVEGSREHWELSRSTPVGKLTVSSRIVGDEEGSWLNAHVTIRGGSGQFPVSLFGKVISAGKSAGFTMNDVAHAGTITGFHDFERKGDPKKDLSQAISGYETLVKSLKGL